MKVPLRVIGDDPQVTNRIGLKVLKLGDEARVWARPWCPDWLPDVPSDGVDGPSATGVNRRLRQPMLADPFVRELGHPTYQSVAQAAAIRAAIDAPEGSTLALVLPTGEGKSLAFHAIARQGYADSPRGLGTTLVVTPTVSLALDHERSSEVYRYHAGPLAYRSGNAAQNELMAERIRDGSQGICFAAPEAVAAGLLRPLLDAARQGLLRALVIDEAHLVDSWGDVFRPEFQLLSGVRRMFIAAGGRPTLRTLLLTATLTDSSAAVLRGLFMEEPGEPLPVSANPSLRPEFDYWTPGLVDASVQMNVVTEAVLNLPRPMILYTTRRERAYGWHARLHDLGLARLGVMTGDTRNAEREALVDRWRLNEVDVVVATSAFGLGIDNRYVRAVVHACAPEGLDRYYQELGRAGRDGCAALSLLVPTTDDVRVGRDLAKRRLISTTRGRQRWRSMFGTARAAGDGESITVRVDVPPGAAARDIDMDNEQSRDWNLRTITMMAMGGLLRIEGAPDTWTGPDGQIHEVIRVGTLQQGHADGDVWTRQIEPYRHRTMTASIGSFGLLLDVLRGRRCVGDALAQEYELGGRGLSPSDPVRPEPTCRGCPSCRALSRPPKIETQVRLAPHPWAPPSVRLPRNAALDPCGRLVVLYDRWFFGASSVTRRRLVLLAFLAKHGFRNLRYDQALESGLEGLQAEAGAQAIFTANHALFGGAMPPGPTVVILDGPLPSGMLRCRSVGDEVIIFMPRQHEPGLQRSNCKTVLLSDLEERTILS
jgi:superfamily II DNA/RNA helicase